MNAISYIVAANGTINAFVNGKSYTMAEDSTYYTAAKNALKASDPKAFIVACNLDLALREKSRGRVTLENGIIMWNGMPVKNGLVDRIMALIKQDFPFEPLIKFLENSLKNPEPQSVDDLYRFLEFNSLPITEDGCFLAWKRVRDDFFDFYSGTVLNKVGTEVSMPRDKVSKGSGVCSGAGLHVCSKDYLKSYHNGEGVVLLVKVNPAHVCAVPTTYQNTKMRVEKYTVLQKFSNEEVDGVNESICSEPIYDTPGKHSKRDPKTGRWTK